MTVCQQLSCLLHIHRTYFLILYDRLIVLFLENQILFDTPGFFLWQSMLRILRLLLFPHFPSVFTRRLSVDIPERFCKCSGSRESIIQSNVSHIFLCVQQFIHRMEQPDIIQIFHECQSQMFFHIFWQIGIRQVQLIWQIIQTDLTLIICLDIILDPAYALTILWIIHIQPCIICFYEEITRKDMCRLKI